MIIDQLAARARVDDAQLAHVRYFECDELAD
jgi:hypothetical protein